MATTELETAVITSGLELAADVAARFEVTREQFSQLEKEFGALVVRGDDLGYMSDYGKFEVLTWAGA